MSLAAVFELEADLEMFCTQQEGDVRQRPGTARLAHWELGFGPVGGMHPIWGLYRFKGAHRVANERELLWRSRPSGAELYRWCARFVDGDLAEHLVAAVGAFDDFYDRYFAARPDFAMTPTLATPPAFIASTARRDEPRTTPVIKAPTALQVITAQRRTAPSSD
jgi:hypothetical protein